MAAAGARFSIREYAARARMREEGGSCWPFGGEAGALPPMEARRFRWWADEAAAVEEEEREVERRMAAKRRKRSVAELFAAVPRVAGGKGKKRAVNGMQANKGKVALAAEVKASNGFKKKVPNGIAVSKKPSSSCLDDRRRSTLPERMIANRQLGKVHRKFVSSGKDLMNSISSSAGSKKSSDERAMDCVPACGYNYFSDDYVSLPLNSRGEFVNLHPADELRSELDTNSFRTNGYNEQPVLPAANNLYVQPATWCNKGELRQPIMPNQAQSSAEDMLLASMHRRNTQNVASVPCLNRRNSVRNFMEKIPAPYQPGYFTQKFSNMTQRNLTSSSLSGYAAVQNSTTQTKFTSLPPLPPSLAPSRIRSLDYAQHRGTNTSTFNPSIPAVHQTSRSGAPGNAMPRDERLKWAVMGSNVEGSGQLNQNGKRPAERDDAFLTSPKKACTASGKDSNLLSGNSVDPDLQVHGLLICLLA
ncbi:hypothetical protein PR202_ga05684 [Eleusine coracana subsp. coracana]|uniref:Uncharacterized protein n=1 Tax=Eleusine coracana subsp. coracana TaxID=191504 RepID=A0AAV5BVJ5_ELECO|nr:hypothetical protein PR202_ga05230 [Eleusine coracana subsp. coracana]GJM89487.1 hypothetical protein PR202_ga05684 [Eleusine coracana subsp. coracana]